ncbi:helix-turn-helix domain-containing protein [Streptomyces sp. NBC_01451]|uniref:helix-turn-helix domain-containing protein n=1 Tax=Streptomyces sp. NBC_01451 TaxID=2903872 RepID=UPI002E36E62A|nr:helix-turn-helix domain-containing protein [Streptomyces sp. NBC_01451]
MTATADSERFAAFLRSLKERSGLSYEALAQRTGGSRSSLHRYCSGSYVPQDYGPVHRFAVVCGAAPDELRHLYRIWAVADMGRMPVGDGEAESARNTVASEPEAGPEAVPGPGTGTGTGAETGTGTATGAGTEADPEAGPPLEAHPAPAPRPRTEAATAGPAEPSAPSPLPVPAEVSAVDGAAVPAAAEAAGHVPAGGVWRRRALPVLGVCFLLLVAGGTWLTLTTRQQASADSTDDGRMLFSAACAEPVAMGQHDACVQEVQRLLSEAGADIDVDSSFGPQTLRRVTAFQVLRGLDANGVVGTETKKALYDPKVRVRSWSPEKVRQRVRQVFTEEPEHAVAIADCQSFLDPLHILPNTNGTRNWGVFQISDARLSKLGGTPREALDPEWNIQAAHRLWKRAGNFDDWPYCERAYNSSPSPSPDASPSPTRS